MKTTRTIWFINTNNSEFAGSEIYTTEAFKEEYGDGQWAVSFAKYGEKEDGRSLGSMDWEAFQSFFSENCGNIGLVQTMTASFPCSAWNVICGSAHRTS